MKLYPIVGLGCQKRVGKDTVARELEKMGWKRVAFADKLKDVVSVLFNDNARDEDFKEQLLSNGMYGRQVLQQVGTGLRDILGPNLWIHAANLRGYAAISPVVVSDVRFENEFRAIKAINGKCIRIVRNTGDCDHHITETGAINLPWDLTLNNDRPESPRLIALRITSLFPAEYSRLEGVATS